MEYSINTEYVDIIAGTSNRYSSIYEAVSKDVDQNNDKGMKYLKNFLQSIENISNKEKVKDERITKSAGNIKNFEGYENIVSANNFLKKNLGSVKGVKDCNEMLDLLEKFQPEYSDGYDKKNRIVILEYESAVYMLVTNLSMIIANNMDVVSNGTEIRIKQKSEETFGVIPKAMSDLLKQMKNPNHKAYLAELNKTISNEPAKKISSEEKVTTEGVYSEDVFMEDPLGVVNTISQVGTLTWQIVVNLGMNIKGGLAAFKKLKHTIFGIVPVIRSISYLRYKKKADTIVALDQQVGFIQANIDQLNKRTNIDPAKKATIIKKQQASIEAYKKKAAKLRAQLMETEKDASTAIAKEDPQMKNTDDDFVLESGKTIKEIFTEADESDITELFNSLINSLYYCAEENGLLDKASIVDLHVDYLSNKIPVYRLYWCDTKDQWFEVSSMTPKGKDLYSTTLKAEMLYHDAMSPAQQYKGADFFIFITNNGKDRQVKCKVSYRDSANYVAKSPITMVESAVAIKKEDLKNKNFNNVIFTWDCC